MRNLHPIEVFNSPYLHIVNLLSEYQDSINSNAERTRYSRLKRRRALNGRCREEGLIRRWRVGSEICSDKLSIIGVTRTNSGRARQVDDA